MTRRKDTTACLECAALFSCDGTNCPKVVVVPIIKVVKITVDLNPILIYPPRRRQTRDILNKIRSQIQLGNRNRLVQGEIPCFFNNIKSTMKGGIDMLTLGLFLVVAAVGCLITEAFYAA